MKSKPFKSIPQHFPWKPTARDLNRLLFSPFPLVRSSMRYWPWKAYRISTWHLARTEKRWGEKAEWTLRGRKRHTLDPSSKSWRFGALVQMDFPFEKMTWCFCCFSRFFFGNPEPASFRKEITRKMPCCYLPKLLRVCCGKIECIQGSNFHTPTTYKRSYGALKDGL